MVLCHGGHMLQRREDGPPQCPPPGSCCGVCRAGGTLAPEELWRGPWGCPSCCRDPRDGFASSPSPHPCQLRCLGGPGVPARAAESSTSTASSASSDGSAGLPTPCCSGTEGLAEETLSAVLASCRLGTGAAIDRRSFIASGLASRLLEELLCQRLPELPEPVESAAQPPERCCATAVASLEWLCRHDHGTPRHEEGGERGWLLAAAPQRDVEATRCHDPPWESRDGAARRRRHREAHGYVCHGVAWHGAHGGSTKLEMVTNGDRDAASQPGRRCRHSRGLTDHQTPAWHEPPVSRQRLLESWGSPWDVPADTGTAAQHGWVSHATLSHELRHCRGAAGAVPRPGWESFWEPESTRHPRDHQGSARPRHHRVEEPAHGPPGWLSRGGSWDHPHPPDATGSRREPPAPMETWSWAPEPGKLDGEWDPPTVGLGGLPERDGGTGGTNMVRIIAKAFELQARRDAAHAERQRQARRCRELGEAEGPPRDPSGCAGGRCWLSARHAVPRTPSPVPAPADPAAE